MVLSASCAKEMDFNQPASKAVLEVGINPLTKTYMGPSDAGSRKVYWSNGDQIAVNGTASDPLAGLEGDNQKAAFSFTTLPPAPYKLLYPAGIFTDDSHVTLPDFQTYKDGNFADGMFPMAGYAVDAEGLGLNYLCAVLKISVLQASGADADTDQLVAVRFKGGNDEQVKGLFSIDYEQPGLSSASSADADKEVKVVHSDATSVTEPATFFLVVPAGSYTNGFELTVQDAKGHFMKQSKQGAVTLVAGKLYNLAEFAFVPTSDAAVSDLVITSAEDLIQFANDYNSQVYDDYGDALSVSLANDISFDATTSAAFNATGGIGNVISTDPEVTNYYHGVFNGNNHTINGLVATVPVFNYAGTSAVIQDLTLASTCSYTVNSPAATAFHGALVGRNKGTVKNCTSNAPVVINNIQDVNEASQMYGGLVGYNYGGTIDGCSATGDISCSQTGQTISKNDTYIGGVVGYQYNAGTIKGSSFKGNIILSDGNTYGAISAAEKYIYIGGIIGRAENAEISNCTAGVDGTPTVIDARGTFVPGIGGIIGWLASSSDSEINSCHNYMSVSYSSNGARAHTTPCRVGGIAGRSAAPVKNCTNNAAVSTVSNSTTVNLAGIVAEGADVSNSTNNAGGTLTRSNAGAGVGQVNRYIYMGGIVGAMTAAADIEECTNHATLTCNVLGTSSATTLDLGGILGAASKQVDITACVNDAEVMLNNDNASAAATARTAIGGILGNVATANTSVSGCTNSGKVWCNNNTAGSYGFIHIGGIIGHTSASSAVTDAANSGDILCQNPGAAISAYVDLGGIVGCAEATITISGTAADGTLNSGAVTVAQSSSAVLYARNTQGGILGYGKGNDTKITNCKNTAKIYCNLAGTKADGRPSYTGGIVGLLASVSYTDNAASGLSALSGLEIGNCNNPGEVNSSNYCNKAGNKNSPFTGGIAGLVSGKSDSKASIHDCTVGTQTVYMYRGTGGGLVGYANMCTLANNTSSANMSGANASVNGVGGIVGRLFDSSMTDCTFGGIIARAKNIGGLVYTISEQNASGSTITGCKVNGATLTTGTAADKTAAAVLVSISDNKTNTISNCGVKGTLDSAPITLSSNMITTQGGAVLTGTYLLD